METYCQKVLPKTRALKNKIKGGDGHIGGGGVGGGEGAVQGSIEIEGGVQIFCTVYKDI